MRPLLFVLPLILAACARTPEERFLAHQRAVDPPQLWYAEVVGHPGPGVFVCAPLAIREGFTRADAEVNGQPCLVQGQPVEKPGLYAARCNVGHRRFAMNLTHAGDPERDVTVRLSLRATDAPMEAVTQTRRYRRMGACPAGWRIGDQARPGLRPRSNVLAG